MSESPRARAVDAALAGGLAALVALATSVFLDGISASIPSLIHGVGQAVIRATPGDLAREGIEAVGTNDKPLDRSPAPSCCRSSSAPACGWATAADPRAMTVGVVVAAVARCAGHAVGDHGAARSGRPSPRPARRPAVSPPFATVRRLGRAGAARRRRPATDRHGRHPPPVPHRRRADRRRGRRRHAASAGGCRPTPTPRRPAAEVVLPGRRRPPAALPAGGRDRASTGITPLVTPNDDFYRIDEALVVPDRRPRLVAARDHRHGRRPARRSPTTTCSPRTSSSAT